MSRTYLEAMFRQGRPLAAYYYLLRRPGDRSVRCKRVEPGLIVDYARGGRPIGIGITAPDKVSAAALNRVLKGLGLPGVRRSDLAPLRVA